MADLGGSNNMRTKHSTTVSLLAFLLAYVFSTFFKASTNVVIPIFQQQFAMSAGVAGFVSSAYFLFYAVMQLLTGPLCRRFGQHKVVGLGYLVSTIGTLVFGFAHNSAMVLIGRILIGIGVGPVYIAAIAFMTDNFEGQTYAIMIGLVTAFGGFGSAVSSAPLQFIVSKFGVIHTFIGLSALTGILAILIFSLSKSYVPRLKVEKTGSDEILGTLVKGCKAIIKSPSLIYITIGWMLLCTFQHSYQGLWSASWFGYAFPKFSTVSGYSSTVVSIGTIVGTLISEKLHKRDLPRNITIIQGEWMFALGCVLVCVAHCIGSFGIKADSTIAVVIMLTADFYFGFTAGHGPVQRMAYARTLTDTATNATVIGVMNAGGCVAVMFYQWLSGVAFDALNISHSPNASFVIPYTILAAVIMITTAISVRVYRKNR